MRRTVRPLAELIGDSADVVAVRTQAEQLLRRHSTTRRLPSIVLVGETGTGKGLLAKAIHEASPRAAGPFVAVNCAAIPETLLESELFGYEQGAFTDARHAKAGLFQTAHRGTLFLDEIGLFPESLQAKLLTVLEDRTVRRLGSTRAEPVDVWIITASSEDLGTAAARRRFREDLFHRLAVVTLRLPPLRERGHDILKLAEHFLANACAEYALTPKTLAEDAREALLAYRWPGNVRELANVMERVALLTDIPLVTASRLELPVPPARSGSPRRDPEAMPPRGEDAKSLDHAVERAERARIHEALRETEGNISHAAERLGVTRNTLRYRLQKYNVRSPAPTERADAGDVAASVESTPPLATGHLHWERRHVALLRAEILATSSASSLLETIVDKVQAFGGHVEELSPRGLVAAFGLEPMDDAPRRAAHAALAIQKIAAHGPRDPAQSAAVRVGLDVRDALIAQLGGVARLEHDAKRGMCSELGAIMDTAQPGFVVVSEATRPFLERRFVVAPFAASEPLPGKAYRLAGLGRAPLGLGEHLTPLVARERELAQLADALEQVRKGRGQAIGIVGEAGVGKSRLVGEFIESQRVNDALVLVSAAASYATATPYSPVVDLLKTYLQIDPHDDPGAVAKRVTQKIPAPLPALLALLDLPTDDAEWSALDPSHKRRRTLDAIKRLILEESRRQPVVLVVEDVHWIDSETQAVLDTLVDSLATHRVLLLVSYRPEYQHTWSNKSCYVQIRVDPLSTENARVFLDRLVGDDAATATLKTILIDRTGGNPFFLEESVRAAVETGVLIGDRGSYRLARATHDIQVPATVHAVLEARIGRLRQDDKVILQTAAAIGKDVPFALLEAVVELPEEPLNAGLMRLRESELLYETTLVPELEYAFKHALSHEVCYAGILPDGRRALHARAMEAIEQVYADRLAEHIDRLAHHAVRSERWDKAVAYCRQAGAKAAARSAYREAVVWFEQALTALTHLPETVAIIEQAIDLRLDLRSSLAPLGELPRIFDHLCRAEALAERIRDERRLGWISAFLTFHFWLASDVDRAVEAGHRALALAEAHSVFPLRIVANLRLGQAYFARGDYARARECFQSNIDALQGDLIRERFGEAGLPSVLSRVWFVQPLIEQGDFAEARTRAEEAVRIAEEADHPYSLVGAYRSLGCVHLRAGDLEHAIHLFERGYRLCQAWKIPTWFFGISSFLGEAYILSRRVAEGLPLLEHMIEQSIAMGHRHAHTRPAIVLSEGYRLLNRIDDAIRLARQALHFSRTHRRPGDEAWALRALGEIAAHREPADVGDAETSYREALAHADKLGMRPLVAHCHLGLGRLYELVGQDHGEREHLMTAATMYGDMGMTSWLEQAKAAMNRV
jgi:DNA-binding NtrC family response regulator/tetratricopeptide (TPR) repeat protein